MNKMSNARVSGLLQLVLKRVTVTLVLEVRSIDESFRFDRTSPPTATRYNHNNLNKSFICRLFILMTCTLLSTNNACATFTSNLFHHEYFRMSFRNIQTRFSCKQCMIMNTGHSLIKPGLDQIYDFI